ncbi:hypothetical protein KI429_06730 [Pseudomonas shirazica]|nr:hypothetical protein KI429_06730 [Pseudomonas shirazica]
MSTNVLSSSVTLTVLNPEKLLHGSEPRHRFDRAGGSIGSQGAWRLHDRGVRILPVHCEISWHEGHFCIVDHSGKSFMNGSDTQLLSGTRTRRVSSAYKPVIWTWISSGDYRQKKA